MSAPKAFQRATIECVLRAFDRRRRVRRFLVADEVGLGKTVVARGVIESMMRQKRKRGHDPLRVFYVCSSLAIAAQNKGNLLKAIPDPETRGRATSDVDRLTLAPNQRLANDVPLHLYTLTPDTSIPDRKGRHRAGTVRERALLHNLLADKYPSLTRIRGQGEWLQRNALESWETWKQSRGCMPSPSLKRKFFLVLREQFERKDTLKQRQHLPPAIRRKIDEDPLEAIKHLRIALAKTGLDVLAPDLVIFDEFQRFQDLLDSSDQSSCIAREMVRTGRGGPAVLLLSATPYRLYDGNSDTWFGEVRHHEQFFDLVKWLFGGDDEAGSRRREELECLFRKYGAELRSANPSGVMTLKIKALIEERLRMVIARTERFGREAGQEAAEPINVPTPLNARDLQIFRHMASCFTNGAEDRTSSTAVAYWSSVPLPMQALGPDYKAWKSAQKSPPKKMLRLAKTDVARFLGLAVWPHPKLRAMCERFKPEKLAVPWLAPSMPWWPLSGKWAGEPYGKVLLFSRFRAVPRTVSGLMSYDLERHLLRRSSLGYRDVTKRPPLPPERKNLAYFHPSTALARLIDPWQQQATSVKEISQYAAEKMKSALTNLGVKIIHNRGSRSRTLPELLVQLERRCDAWKSSLEAWDRLAQEDASRASLQARVHQWDEAVRGQLDVVDRREIKTLADAALSSPGSVLARSLERHRLCLDGSDNEATTYHALRTSWVGLRSYLNNQWMSASIGGRGNYRDRISRAILDGNLEAVLDEHLWVTGTLRHLDPDALAAHLTTALSLRTSDVKLHGLEGRKSDYHLRSHAVLAFNQAVRRHRPGMDEGKDPAVRTEEVRNAFNSPFWPHVLVTTSVGQEGLDFHTWCAAIAHWDLPGNPVDLEQREGRIDRYAGLAIRRKLAEKFAPNLTRKRGCSPWKALASQAEKGYEDDPSGLAPWWIVEGAQVQRLIFDIPLSEAQARLKSLRQQRFLYRLALGQPDQADLVQALHGRISPEEATAATINLSPLRHSVNAL